MANPNIVTATSILGKSTYLSLANTSATTLLSNASGSGQLYKVNSLVVANIDGTNSADITISVNNAASGGGTAYKIAHTVAVSADSTLVVIDKTSQIYLEENTSIVVTASAGGDLDVVCSYEIIS
jgi:tripartite-type tricarboxylate transporter receptor subunit TctC